MIQKIESFQIFFSDIAKALIVCATQDISNNYTRFDISTLYVFSCSNNVFQRISDEVWDIYVLP